MAMGFIGYIFAFNLRMFLVRGYGATKIEIFASRVPDVIYNHRKLDLSCNCLRFE